jgi:hypothetical protein
LVACRAGVQHCDLSFAVFRPIFDTHLILCDVDLALTWAVDVRGRGLGLRRSGCGRGRGRGLRRRSYGANGSIVAPVAIKVFEVAKPIGSPS